MAIMPQRDAAHIRWCFSFQPGQHERTKLYRAFGFRWDVARELQPMPPTAVIIGGVWDLKRVHPMKAYVVSDGRLLALKPSEWSLLLVGVALCGMLVLLF